MTDYEIFMIFFAVIGLLLKAIDLTMKQKVSKCEPPCRSQLRGGSNRSTKDREGLQTGSLSVFIIRKRPSRVNS